MPKLKNITNAELTEAIDGADELLGQLLHYGDRVRQGYADPMESIVSKVSSLLALSSAASGLAQALLQQMRLNELKAETEALLRAQVDKDP